MAFDCTLLQNQQVTRTVSWLLMHGWDLAVSEDDIIVLNALDGAVECLVTREFAEYAYTCASIGFTIVEDIETGTKHYPGTVFFQFRERERKLFPEIERQRAKETTYLGRYALKMRPTRMHYPAVWECMLGTVHAMNQDRVVKYFDYDHDAAFEYAGYDRERDPRVYRFQGECSRYSYSVAGCEEPRHGQMVLWLLWINAD